MADFLTAAADGASRAPLDIFVRLIVAMVMGGGVAWIYRATRRPSATTPSFTVTLVLLTILIAMVTQVIGDNVARAFSLVGALSIVRFRTVVRDTQDTAYVIFAVAVGMAVGAAHPWLAVGAMAVVGFAAWLMREGAASVPVAAGEGYLLEVRMNVGSDPNAVLGPACGPFLASRRLQAVSTARQGMAIDVVYRVELHREDDAGELVKGLNRVDGVQAVALRREGIEID
jgi:hypothetical protein